jgi:periplasmic protein CpxP/Spy
MRHRGKGVLQSVAVRAATNAQNPHRSLRTGTSCAAASGPVDVFDERISLMSAFHVTRRAALASALFLAVGTTAYAGSGHGPHGHGHGARGEGVHAVIAQVRAQLNLNTQQQLAFDNAVAASKAARQNGRSERETVHAAMQAELAKPAPDLRAVAAAADQAQAANQAARRQVREQWLALYDTFTPEQKLVVRDALAKRAQRMEAFRDSMRERFGG